MIFRLVFFESPETENDKIQNPNDFTLEKHSRKVWTKVACQFLKKNEMVICGIQLPTFEKAYLLFTGLPQPKRICWLHSASPMKP